MQACGGSSGWTGMSIPIIFLENSKKSFFISIGSFYICKVSKEGQTTKQKNLENSQKSFFLSRRFFYFS